MHNIPTHASTQHSIYGVTHGATHGPTYLSMCGAIHGLMHATEMTRQGCTASGIEPDMNDIFVHGSTQRATDHSVVRVTDNAEACSRLVMRC